MIYNSSDDWRENQFDSFNLSITTQVLNLHSLNLAWIESIKEEDKGTRNTQVLCTKVSDKIELIGRERAIFVESVESLCLK